MISHGVILLTERDEQRCVNVWSVLEFEEVTSSSARAEGSTGHLSLPLAELGGRSIILPPIVSTKEIVRTGAHLHGQAHTLDACTL